MAGIIERKNKKGDVTSYRIKVSMGYDINGKQLSKTMTWTPPLDMTKNQIKKELNRQAVLFEQKCKQGQCVDESIRFADLSEMWFTDYAENNLKKTTLVSYKKMLKVVLPAIGHISIGKLQPHNLNTFYNMLLEQKIGCNVTCHSDEDFRNYINVHNGIKYDKPRMSQNELAEKSAVSIATIHKLLKGDVISVECAKKICETLGLEYKKVFKETDRNTISPSTVKRYHALISSICSFAVLQNIIPINPCTRVKPPKVNKHEADYLDEEETTKLLNTLQTAPQPFRTAIQLLLFTGIRRGEMCGLSWEDIDFEHNVIRIKRNVLYTQETGVYEDTPKTATSVRAIKISSHVIGLINDYNEWQKEQQHKCSNQWCESKRVFTNDLGVPLHPSSVSKWFARFNQQNGLRHIPLHSLRHTSASILVMNGVPLNAVSKRLGHACAATTSNIYSHVFRMADEMAAEALDDVIFKKTSDNHSA